jgi:hypothetical protein
MIYKVTYKAQTFVCYVEMFVKLSFIFLFIVHIIGTCERKLKKLHMQKTCGKAIWLNSVYEPSLRKDN